MGTPATDFLLVLLGAAAADAVSPAWKLLPSAAGMGAAMLRCAPLLLAILPLAGLPERWPAVGGGPATITISGSAMPLLPLLPPLFQGLLGAGCLVRCLIGTATVVAE